MRAIETIGPTELPTVNLSISWRRRNAACFFASLLLRKIEARTAVMKDPPTPTHKAFRTIVTTILRAMAKLRVKKGILIWTKSEG